MMCALRFFVLGVAGLAIAGCAAGNTSLPAARGLAPTSIWVSFRTGGAMNIFPANSDGLTTPSLAGVPGFGGPGMEPLNGVVAFASSADGTMWPLATSDAVNGGRNWRMISIAPRETGATSPALYDGDGRPQAAALGSDGVMVEADTQPLGLVTIRTYPYGAVDPPAIRTFTKSAVHLAGFAIGPDGLMYIPRRDGFDVFRADSTGCCALKTIHTASVPSGFTMGTDGSIYAIELSNYLRPGATMVVNVYPPGSETIGRRVGPLPVTNDALGAGPAIAVDRHDRLYVATNDRLYVFAAGADGPAQPLHTITYSDNDTVRAIAAGP